MIMDGSNQTADEEANRAKQLAHVMHEAAYGDTVAKRTRALFALKASGCDAARGRLETTMKEDDSILIRHEAAYLLGQLGSVLSLESLKQCVENGDEHPMVRHEAAEAIGAIGHADGLEILNKYKDDNMAPIELQQTCKIAAGRIEWLNAGNAAHTFEKSSVYQSVDPAPPACGSDPALLGKQLADSGKSLFERYRAMFALRNMGGRASLQPLCDAMTAGSGDPAGALLRHEVAFVLGQMCDPESIQALAHSLANTDENPMVRHEAAEALGSIGTKEANDVLHSFRNDDSIIVRESVHVALDIVDYYESNSLHYAPPATTTNTAIITNSTAHNNSTERK